MTPSERAQRIPLWLEYTPERREETYALIAAEIQSAINADRDPRTSDDLYKAAYDKGFLDGHACNVGHETIEAAYRRGVEEEREACAKVAENLSDDYHNDGCGDAIATQIRARTTERGSK